MILSIGQRFLVIEIAYRFYLESPVNPGMWNTCKMTIDCDDPAAARRILMLAQYFKAVYKKRFKIAGTKSEVEKLHESIKSIACDEDRFNMFVSIAKQGERKEDDEGKAGWDPADVLYSDKADIWSR